MLAKKEKSLQRQSKLLHSDEFFFNWNNVPRSNVHCTMKSGMCTDSDEDKS